MGALSLWCWAWCIRGFGRRFPRAGRWPLALSHLVPLMVVAFGGFAVQSLLLDERFDSTRAWWDGFAVHAWIVAAAVGAVAGSTGVTADLLVRVGTGSASSDPGLSRQG